MSPLSVYNALWNCLRSLWCSSLLIVRGVRWVARGFCKVVVGAPSLAIQTSTRKTMNIYLVRVSERQDKSLFIERKTNATTSDDYIAISHVWGTPETIQPTEVDGAGIVQLSPGKKDILPILRRNDVCGEGWFWMDLFCIDQSESASISISEQLMAIPSVYKSSRCVKVLIETPVCEIWQSQALRVISNPGADLDGVFGEEELAHGRKCPEFLFCDPWFERLWTRQEGLYGQILDIVILNPVACRRHQVAVGDKTQGWIMEGSALAKRTVTEFFLFDKLAYHGLSPSQSEKVQFEVYLDLVYRHRLDFTKFGGLSGPAPNYSPLSEAWKSNRTTTKPRDYVLAVFPDIEGYKVPPNARKMQFPELLADALSQPSIRDRYEIAPKIPKGMMSATSSKQSTTAWTFQEPSTIGEAYDSFTVLLSDSPRTAGGKFFAVAKDITLAELDFSRSNLPAIVDMWVNTADNLKHVVNVSPSGPCTGTTRGDVRSEEGLLHQFFFHQFAPPAVALHLPKSKLDTLEFRTTGVLSFNRVGSISEEIFSHELRRFLTCLLCGTSLHVADVVLELADLRCISTVHGKLLALIRRDMTAKVKPEDLVLLGTSLWFKQGFLIAHQSNAGLIIVGRTTIPRSDFWDSMEKAAQA